MQALTHEEFLKKIPKSVKANVTIIGKYKGSQANIRVECKCGTRYITKPEHLYASKIGGCKECNQKKRGKSYSVSQSEQWKKQFRLDIKRHPSIKLESDFVSMTTETKFRCLDCQSKFKMTPFALLRCSDPCIKCREPKINPNTKSEKQYRKDLRTKHGNTIKLVSGYTVSSEKALHRCGECKHEWEIKPVTVMYYGNICPACAKLKTNFGNGYSSVSIEWLESISKKKRIYIRHAENGGEYLIPGTRFRVDGFNPRTKTVFEFYGDKFHGNPKVYSPRQKIQLLGNVVTAGKLYQKTKERERIIRNMGYNVVSIWESEYRGVK